MEGNTSNKSLVKLNGAESHRKPKIVKPFTG